MKHIVITGAICVSLAGCTEFAGGTGLFGAQPNDVVEAPSDPFVATAPEIEATPLTPATSAPPPPETAQTVEALDTTTPEQRALASAPPAEPVATLGTTVVSLGSPTEPGLWIKTPLVTEAAQGRVTNPATGDSSLVSLLPLEGEETAGSRMSLGAMRLIGAPLTGLTEVEVALEG